MSKRKPYVFAPAKSDAPVHWSSIETRDAEIAQANELRERRAAEFQEQVTGLDPVSRRSFMSIMGASVALATMAGCRRPVEHILPYARPPEGVIPGVPQHYATVYDRAGEALGLVVESHEGRPTKIEGNPDHPASRGATDLITQASVLDLYDPDRSRQPRQGDANKTWVEFDTAFGEALAAHQANGGAGLRVLALPTISPSFVRLRDAVMARLPQARFHTWDGAARSNAREGARLAFGTVLHALHDFERARVILSLDADFLQTEPGAVRNMRGFANGRRVRDVRHGDMSRLYVVEPTMTVTGANADHRLRLPAREVETYLLALAARLGVVDAALGSARGTAAPAGVASHWIEAVAADLLAHRGASVLVAGSRQPPRVHALVHAINEALGNVGQTVSFYPVADPNEPEQTADLRALVQAMEQSQVQTLVILGGNPVYDAPGDLDFAAKLRNVRTSVHFGSHRDETGELCTWHAPRAHYLETWGDAMSLDGTVSIQQPLIAPLFAGRSDIEVLAQIAQTPGSRRGHDLVRETLRAGQQRLGTNAAGGLLPANAIDRDWRRALFRGVVGETAGQPVTQAVRAADIATQLAARQPGAALSGTNVEVVFLVDQKLYDGRHANNAWLMEFPDPVTKITWDNAAYVSMTTARALGLENGDMIRLARGGRSIEVAAWIVPGQADGSIAVSLGWGRTKAGRVAAGHSALAGMGEDYRNGHGFNVNPLRDSSALHFMDGVTLTKLDRRYRFSQTQEHHRMEGRPIALEATLDEFRRNPELTEERAPTPRTLPLWREVNYDFRNKWGMVIDLNACTGCGACAVACQAENNVPVVGKEQVYRGREMHWLRVDRYYVGTVEDPLTTHQPLMCVQCEEAPCENVCPVAATAHSPEGLNDMAYNRCIGTRYCSNNCPYKVRRFNYLNWHTDEASVWRPDGDVPETVRMQHNPNVTVRFRGVMEKCTYCVQRIQTAKIAAKREGRVESRAGHFGDQQSDEQRRLRVNLRDGEVITACSQVCPADAIVFGDLNDPTHRVAQLARTDRRYKLLGELGTQPRTTYLAKIRNPNSAMGTTTGGEHGGSERHEEAH